MAEFTAKVEQLDKDKADYVVPARGVHMVEDKALMVDGLDDQKLVITDYAHGQIASKLNIPKAYYDNAGAIPGLRDYNVNAWLQAQDDRMMVRTYPGQARAIVSDKFRTIDNMFVLSCLLPVLHTMKGDIEIHSNNLTDRRMYLEISNRAITGEVKVGDTIRAGIIISNSEVGAGAVNMSSLLWRLACSNGMVRENILRRYHVGKRLNPETEDYWKDDTIKAEMLSLQLRLRDAIAHAFTQQALEEQLGELRRAVDDRIFKPMATIENVTKKFAIPQAFSEAMLENMASEGNMNRYGLSNAITHLAHDLDSADTAYEMQRLGSRIIELTPSEWEVVNAA